MKDRKLNKNYESNTKTNVVYSFLIVLLCFTFLLSLVNVIILCVICPRQQDISKILSFDYVGVILAIFSILVTLLVGWQIFNSIDFKDKIDKKIENQYSELKNELDSKSKELIKEINEKSEISAKNSLFVSLCQLGTAFNHCKAETTVSDGSENKGQKFNEIDAISIQVLFNALSIYKESMEDDLSKEAFNNCMIKLKEYAKNKAVLVVNSKDEYDFFTHTAINTKDIEIIKFAYNFKIQE